MELKVCVWWGVWRNDGYFGEGWVGIWLRFIDINIIFAAKATVTRPKAQVELAQQLVYWQINDGFGLLSVWFWFEQLRK